MTTDAEPRPPLDVERLVGLGVEVVAQAGSTNALLAERAIGGAPDGAVLVAEHQTAGRGRLARGWVTPARAALTFSALCRPTRPATDWPWLPLVTGVAVAEALRGHDVPAELKWPNDVLLGGRKLAGILAERVDTPAGPAVVLGIGLNVTTTAAELPVETATSIRLATGRSPDRTELLVALLAALRRQYAAWATGGAAAVRPAYTPLCATLGRDVLVTLPGGRELRGAAQDVDSAGRLVVAGVPVAAGDVVHVRTGQ